MIDYIEKEKLPKPVEKVSLLNKKTTPAEVTTPKQIIQKNTQILQPSQANL
jgi:hypothetical protein